VSRYAVDLDELMAFAGRLAQFTRRAEEIAKAVDQEIAQLHGTWAGLGAEAEKHYHETWMRLAGEMRESAEQLRMTAHDAHRNYTDVAALNSSMWP
jgi:WXG100 family type VII secretion target